MIIDGHCDMLYRVWSEGLDLNKDKNLHVDLEKWRNSPVQVQTFAMCVVDEMSEEKQYQAVLDMVKIFKEQVIEANEDIVHIKSKSDLDNLKPKQRGAVLALEGCHPIGTNLNKLRHLIDEGVRLVGLTWNNSNALADSIEEEHPKGVTEFGQTVIEYLNSEDIWIDVSHLSVPAFFDVMKLAKHPIASHSNARGICDVPRNLTDEQIEALIERDSLIGVVLYPAFLTGTAEADIEDVMDHIDYFMKKGAENVLCIGSDFDGIERTVTGLENISKYSHLVTRLREDYPGQADDILGRNYKKKFPRKG